MLLPLCFKSAQNPCLPCSNLIFFWSASRSKIKKPMVGFIAGLTAPQGRTMGHAGAIVSGGKGGAEDKIESMKSAGITISKSPADIGKTLLEKLNR